MRVCVFWICILFPQSDGVAVGFISVSGDINLKLLNDGFELGMFNGLYKPSQADKSQPAPQWDQREDATTSQTQASDQQDGTEKVLSKTLNFHKYLGLHCY